VQGGYAIELMSYSIEPMGLQAQLHVQRRISVSIHDPSLLHGCVMLTKLMLTKTFLLKRQVAIASRLVALSLGNLRCFANQFSILASTQPCTKYTVSVLSAEVLCTTMKGWDLR